MQLHPTKNFEDRDCWITTALGQIPMSGEAKNMVAAQFYVLMDRIDDQALTISALKTLLEQYPEEEKQCQNCAYLKKSPPVSTTITCSVCGKVYPPNWEEKEKLPEWEALSKIIDERIYKSAKFLEDRMGADRTRTKMFRAELFKFLEAHFNTYENCLNRPPFPMLEDLKRKYT